MGDGEKTFGFIDYDGSYNPTMLGGYKQAFVFAHEHKTMTTGCLSIDEAPEMGIGKPGIKVCPFDVKSATIEIEYGDHVTGFQKGQGCAFCGF